MMIPLFLLMEPYVIPSINRVKVMDLPKLNSPLQMKGMLAYHLLSAEALRQQILA